jgi:hypothetical protein
MPIVNDCGAESFLKKYLQRLQLKSKKETIRDQA